MGSVIAKRGFCLSFGLGLTWRVLTCVNIRQVSQNQERRCRVCRRLLWRYLGGCEPLPQHWRGSLCVLIVIYGREGTTWGRPLYSKGGHAVTRQKSDTLFDMPPLPGDRFKANGERSSQSRWTTFERRDLLVTQEDIDNAMRNNSHSCMVAEAIKRQIKGATKVAVDIATIRWTDTIKNRRIMCLTPLVCQEGLARFDLGVAPPPFRFNLRSAQITTAPYKAAADGAGVQRPATTRKRVKADGSLAENANGFQVERVAPPQPRIEPMEVNLHPVVRGGRLPQTHRASRNRKFGMKGFTWLDGENPEDIIARQRLAYGVDK